jgi:hypothetical protein
VNWGRGSRKIEGKGNKAHHLGETPRRHDIPGVDEPIQMPGRLLNGLAHLIVAVEVEHVGYQVQGILVVLHLGVEAGQVEAIGQVLLVDLAKVLVAARRDELRNGRVNLVGAYANELDAPNPSSSWCSRYRTRSRSHPSSRNTAGSLPGCQQSDTDGSEYEDPSGKTAERRQVSSASGIAGGG